MRQEGKTIKKRRKRNPPIIKFAFIIILIVAAGFFIFYSIDNPVFFSSLKGKLFSHITSSSDGVEVSEIEADESRPAEDKDAADSSGNDSSETDAAEMPAGRDTEKSESLWQKIINYFKKAEEDTDGEDTFPKKLKINFYFCGLGEDKKFISEERTITAGNMQAAAINAMQEILQGPSKTYYYAVIPGGTKLLGVETQENIVKVNLSEEFFKNSLDSRILDEYIIYSIVDTLTEIPGIEGVVFYIDGKRIKVYGNVDLSIPAVRNEEYLGQE
jgi:spore germination protein GerM